MQLMQGRPFGTAANLGKEILRERQTFQCSADFEKAVKLVRDIADLDHLSHVEKIQACVAHVNTTRNLCWVVYGYPRHNGSVGRTSKVGHAELTSEEDRIGEATEAIASMAGRGKWGWLCRQPAPVLNTCGKITGI
jgi:hypothetical protein